jgi:hypothetical protein
MAYSINTDITEDIFNTLYNHSALTLEGLDPDSIKDYADYLNEVCGLKDNAVFHIISGKSMNYYYNLTNTNAYPDDLNIVVIDLSDLNDVNKIIFKRFEFGGRWFDDVIDNNLSCEVSC